MKTRIALPLVLVVISLTGCTSCASKNVHVTNLPAGVSEQEVKDWKAATDAMQEISQFDLAATKAVIDARHAGFFPDTAAYNVTLTALGKIAQTGKAGDAFLRQSPDHFGQPVKSQIFLFYQDLSVQLEKISRQGVTGIKNPASLQTVNSSIDSITAAVRILAALTQGG